MEIKTFLTKHIFLFGLILSIGFLFVAGFKYPGESSKDINSVGYNWRDNYISNLLEYKAVNGMENKARPFGVMGVVLLGLCSGLALVRLSNKVDSKKFSIVIKYLGIILVIL